MTRSRITILIIGIFTVIIVGAVILFVFFIHSTETDTPGVLTKEAELSFVNYSGEEVVLSDFRKKTVIVYSWASWCLYCGDELKNLARIKEIYGDDIVAIAINRAEPRAVAKGFSDSLELPSDLIVLLDPTDAFYKRVEGYAMPEMVAFNRAGDTVFHQRGPLSFEEMVKKINTLIEL